MMESSTAAGTVGGTALLFLRDESVLGTDQKALLDREGHLLLPGWLTADARVRLTEALSDIDAQVAATKSNRPQRYSAEHNGYLAGLITHPQLLALARSALGPDIRFDHCVALNRPGGDHGIGWHSHDYAEERPDLGFLRIFFYVNGFQADDGGLKVVPGSHRFRDPKIRAADDTELSKGWLRNKTHPDTGAPLAIETLNAPEGSVVLMWTHAAHAVTARKPGSPVRWSVVYAYRNPGAPPSPARWISPEFEQNPPPGAERLLLVD
jgi:phytanoyl-CoA hydroxylase